MEQIAVVSGKGGTGKTTFSSLAHTMIRVVADCDVDAPNLHILLSPEIEKKEDFFSARKAVVNGELCTSCGLCRELCRFGAVQLDELGKAVIDGRKCEGCAFCYNVCVAKAIEMVEVKTGEIYLSKTKWGKLVHALLKPGEENTGKLVTEVRERAKIVAEEVDSEYVVIDSPPGIGCPVMASLANVRAALVVTEPTMSAMSDLERILSLCKHFRVKPFVAVNRYDLNKSVTSKIEEFCDESGVEVLARIPFDGSLAEQVSNLSFPFTGKAADEILKCWDKLIDKL